MWLKDFLLRTFFHEEHKKLSEYENLKSVLLEVLPDEAFEDTLSSSIVQLAAIYDEWVQFASERDTLIEAVQNLYGHTVEYLTRVRADDKSNLVLVLEDLVEEKRLILDTIEKHGIDTIALCDWIRSKVQYH